MLLILGIMLNSDARVRADQERLAAAQARAREEDRELPPQERGWRDVDRLLRMLKMDQNALNVSIHRARQQLSATGLEGAAGIVETKRGKRRLGTDRFEIVRLED